MSHDTSALVALAVVMFVGAFGIAFVLFGGVRRLLEKPFIKQQASVTVTNAFLPSHISLKQLPELNGLNSQQRLVVFRYYQTHSSSAFRAKLVEVGMIGSIIFAEIAGFVGGAIYWRAYWGSLIGGILAMWFIMGAFSLTNYLVGRYITIPKMRSFFQSETGRWIIDQTKSV